MKDIKRYSFVLLRFLLVTLVFTVIYLIYRRVLFTFSFTDEGDNISIGKFLLHGKILYRDIFSQHQPLTYYFSAIVQKVTKPDNLYLVVKRHREAIIFYSFLWSILLTIRFGLGLIFPIIIYELIKYYLLGHLFLAETIVVYPLIFLILSVWMLFKGNKLTKFDNIIASLSIFWASFNLLPAAPVALVLGLYLFFKQRKELWKIISLGLPLMITTLVLFLFIPFYYYFEGTIWANIFFYIPKSSSVAFDVREPFYFRLLKIPFYPLQVLFNLTNPFFQALALIFIIFLVFLIMFAKKNKKNLLFTLFLLTVLFISNLRSPVGSGIYFHAFHSLPYVGLLIFLPFIIVQDEIFSDNKKKFLLFLLLGSFFIFNRNLFYWEKIDPVETQYIQFSKVFDASIAFKTLADKDDTLAVIPYEEILYWLPDVDLSTRFLFYSSWAYVVPKFRNEITEGLVKNKPTFIYWYRQEYLGVENPLFPFLDDNDYVNLPRDATFSGVYINKNKVKDITEEEWKTLQYYRYNKIESTK